MTTDRRRAVAALTAAGLAWGTTVPLSKLALGWLAPGWLTFARFGLAAAVLLAVASRAGLRAACTPSVLATGAIGYGGSVLVQNAGITRTSVTHAALLIGAAPVLVAIIAALWHRTVARPVAWAGFAVSLAGVGLITGGHGGGATAQGDALVLASLLLSAGFTVAQARVLPGRDPVAVTAIQFLGAALAVLPFSVTVEAMPSAPPSPGVALAAAALALGGTLLPFTLFAYGQSRISAEVAGAFLNLEPLVGAVTGAVAFADPVGPPQVTGGLAIIAGIALSSIPLLAGNRRRPRPCAAPPAGSARRPARPVGKSRPAAQAPVGATRTCAARCPDRPPRASTGSRRHGARGGTRRAGHHRVRLCKITGHGSRTAIQRHLHPDHPPPAEAGTAGSEPLPRGGLNVAPGGASFGTWAESQARRQRDQRCARAAGFAPATLDPHHKGACVLAGREHSASRNPRACHASWRWLGPRVSSPALLIVRG